MARLKENSTIEGIPIATQDDLDTIETKVTEGKTYIVDAINNRGISASVSDTFQQLADKIMDITGGEGDIKFATGDGVADTGGIMQITGLNFPPKTIFYYDDLEGVFAFYSDELNVNIRGEHIFNESVFEGEVSIEPNGFTMRTSPHSNGKWIALG